MFSSLVIFWQEIITYNACAAILIDDISSLTRELAKKSISFFFIEFTARFSLLVFEQVSNIDITLHVHVPFFIRGYFSVICMEVTAL